MVAIFFRKYAMLWIYMQCLLPDDLLGMVNNKSGETIINIVWQGLLLVEKTRSTEHLLPRENEGTITFYISGWGRNTV